MLNDAQKAVLEKIYNNTPCTISDFAQYLNEQDTIGRVQEMGMYLKELEARGLVKIGTAATAEGGRQHAVYKNSFRIIWFDKISLTPEGYNFIESELHP